MKSPLILGYSRTGRSLASYFEGRGMKYWVYDEAKKKIPESVDIEFIEKNVDKISEIIRSPGFPMNHRVVEICLEEKINVTTDMHIAAPYLEDKTVFVVSGTDGKSTVVSFLEQMLEKLGKKVVACGNNEIPILTVLGKIEESECVVIELSSYMLENSPPIKSNCLILTNITPDHLNRYRDYLGYVAAKKNSFGMLGEGSVYVQNVDDEILGSEDVMKLMNEEKVKVIRVTEDPERDAEWHIEKKDGYVRYHYFTEDSEEKNKSLETKRIWSDGQMWNMGLSLAGLQGMGYRFEEIELEEIRGLRHRLERVSTRREVRVYNDAKSTTIGALKSALKSFPKEEEMHIIIGGEDKGQDFKELQRQKEELGNKTFYIMGKNGVKKAIELGVNKVYVEEDLKKCIEMSWKKIKKGEILLFSPACGSEHPFENYRERGEYFEKTIRDLDKLWMKENYI